MRAVHRGRRAIDAAPRIADAQLVQPALGEDVLVARRRSPRRRVRCGPSVPLVTPLPSGSGVTGTNVSPKLVTRANSRSAPFAQVVIDADADLVLVDASRRRRADSCSPFRRPVGSG